MRKINTLVLAAVLLSAGMGLKAANITWTGGAGNGYTPWSAGFVGIADNDSLTLSSNSPQPGINPAKDWNDTPGRIIQNITIDDQDWNTVFSPLGTGGTNDDFGLEGAGIVLTGNITVVAGAGIDPGIAVATVTLTSGAHTFTVPAGQTLTIYSQLIFQPGATLTVSTGARFCTLNTPSSASYTRSRMSPVRMR